MEYPLIVRAKTVGSLKVCREGLYTVFEATVTREDLEKAWGEPPAACGESEPLRLSVYGGGREGYLGVMTPWQGGLFLRKKLSKSSMSGFPEEIEYASLAGSGDENKVVEKDVAPKPEQKPEVERETVESERSMKGESQPVKNPQSPAKNGHKPATAQVNAARPAENGKRGNAAGGRKSTGIPEGELNWFRCVDGSLRAFDGRSSIIALPAQLRGNPKGAVLRRINGRMYMLFRY